MSKIGHKPIAEEKGMPCCWCIDGIDCKKMSAYLKKRAAQHRLHQTAGRRGSKKSKLVVPAAGKA